MTNTAASLYLESLESNGCHPLPDELSVLEQILSRGEIHLEDVLPQPVDRKLMEEAARPTSGERASRVVNGICNTMIRHFLNGPYSYNFEVTDADVYVYYHCIRHLAEENRRDGSASIAFHTGIVRARIIEQYLLEKGLVLAPYFKEKSS